MLSEATKKKLARMRAKKMTAAAIAAATGLSADQVKRNWGPAPLADEIVEAEPSRKDVRDAAFWRAKANGLEKQLADAEHVAEQLAGVRDQRIEPPEWMAPSRRGKPSKSVVGLLLTDVHAGEVVDADELMGLNEFNIAVCRKRLRRYFAASCEIGARWTVDCSNQGALLVLGGDLVSGDIHEELRITNELTAHEQVRFVVEEIAAGVDHLRAAFGRVHVVSVPGNHGRTTMKPTAKLYSKLSYDTLAATMIADRFADVDGVSFQISDGADAIVQILGHTVFVNHGDKMGTGGGQGFAGPLLPIVRGTKKIEAQQARAHRRPDLILHGHYHTSANPGAVLSNGSVPGYTEYGNGLRAVIEPPQQWLFLVHEKWKLRERVEVQLEDPMRAVPLKTAAPRETALA